VISSGTSDSCGPSEQLGSLTTSASGNREYSTVAPKTHNGDGTWSSISYSGAVEDVFTTGVITMELATCLLADFKAEMTPQFPFVIIPAETTIDVLRKEKPFLLLAILTATSYNDQSLQRQLGNEVKQYIGNRMIVNGETSLDLLQGLLIYLAWYVF
jgi:hypothetical protein